MYHGILSKVVTAVNLPCPICRRGHLKPARQDISFEGVNLGRFSIEVCTHCAERFIEGEASGALDRAYIKARNEGTIPGGPFKPLVLPRPRGAKSPKPPAPARRRATARLPATTRSRRANARYRSAK